MADMSNVVKLAVDAHRGRVEKYSTDQSMEVLRKALVEANGGSTVLNYRNIRDGKCNGVFTLIEEILSRTIYDGLSENDFFMNFVEYRNVAEGDQNVFLVEDSDLFYVADIADGTQGIRRQRLGGVNEVSIPTTMRAVKIYEEMNRVLSGRVDFNQFITKVSESMQQKRLNDIYDVWANATADQFGGTTYFPAAGSYSEDALLDLISHVEAAAGGRVATIVGTKKAVRNLAPSIQGSDSESDIYNMGFYGKFYGNPVVALPQRHKINSTEFILPDNVLTIIATDEKPIKFITEGNPLVIMGNPLNNGDLTQEYFYGEKTGLGIVTAGGNSGIGRYEIDE